MLTFCTKASAIRDSSNLPIACAGEDGQIWQPQVSKPHIFMKSVSKRMLKLGGSNKQFLNRPNYNSDVHQVQDVCQQLIPLSIFAVQLVLLL